MVHATSKKSTSNNTSKKQTYNTETIHNLRRNPFSTSWFRRISFALVTSVLLSVLLSVSVYSCGVSNYKFYNKYTANHGFFQLSKYRGGGNGGGSLFKIDPSGILAAIAQYGNLVLPSAMDHDLKILEKVCSCDLSSIDLLHRELEIRNWTVSVPMDDSDTNKMHPAALKIGRLKVSWNSYLHPCLDVELEDVDILVEFTNSMLTKTNWNELSDLGFPPTMYLYGDTNHTKSTDASKSTTNTLSSSSQSMLQIKSINLLGSVRLHIHSRPLNEPIAPTSTLEFSSLQKLMDEINTNECRSTEELYDILLKFVQKRVREILAQTVKELALSSKAAGTAASTIVRDTKHAWNEAKEILSSYAEKVINKKEKDVVDHIGDRFKEWGLDLDTGSVLSETKKWKESLRQNYAEANKLFQDQDQDQDLDQDKKRKIGVEGLTETNFWKGLKSVSDLAVERFLGYKEPFVEEEIEVVDGEKEQMRKEPIILDLEEDEL